MAKGWNLDPSAFAGLVEEDVGKRLRIISMALLAEIVQRSPVGNPALWNVNQEQIKNINRVNDINEALRNSPNFGYTDKNGNRRIRRGNKVGLADAVYSSNAGRLGPQRVRKLQRGQGEIYRPKGYHPGSYRASHLVSVNAPDMTVTDHQDVNGSATIANGNVQISGSPNFCQIYIQTNLPYAEKIETGHSRQAPAGVYALSFHGVSQAYK